MNSNDYTDKSTVNGRWFFLVFAVVSMALFFIVTPDLLISLGPMRKTLTSEDISIRRIAYLEVSVFRGICLLASVLCLIIFLKFGKIWESKWVRRIRNHSLRETKKHEEIMSGWNISLVVMICCLAVGLLYVGLISRFLDRSVLQALNREDGLIEYASAAIFFICSIFSLFLSFKFPGQTSRVFIYRLFSVGFFLMAGEEISWGQRIFNLETADIMKEINVHAENNLHNLFGYFADHLFIAGVFVYGFVLPVMANRILFFRKLFDFTSIPVASLGLAIGFLMISLVHDWTIYAIFEKVTFLRMAELRELLTAIAFLLLVYESSLLLPRNDTLVNNKY